MWYPAIIESSAVPGCQCSYTNWIHSSSGYFWHVLTAVERQVFALIFFHLALSQQADSKQVRAIVFNLIHREDFILFGRLAHSSGTSELKSSTVYLLLCRYNRYVKRIVQSWGCRNILLLSTQHSASSKGLTFWPLCQLIWFALVHFLP